MSASIAHNYDCFTKYPNYLLDTVLRRTTTLAQHKVVEAVIRRTIGYNKGADRISYSQFEEMTSMSRPSIVTGIAEAIKAGFIERVAQGQYFVYSLATQLVKSLYQLGETSKEFLPVDGAATSKEFLPEAVKTFNRRGLKVVKTFNPQKKEGFKERKENSLNPNGFKPEDEPLAVEGVRDKEVASEGQLILNSVPETLPDQEQVVPPPPPPETPRPAGTLIQRYHQAYLEVGNGKGAHTKQNGIIGRAWTEVLGSEPDYKMIEKLRGEYCEGQGWPLVKAIISMAGADPTETTTGYLIDTLKRQQERGYYDRERGRLLGKDYSGAGKVRPGQRGTPLYREAGSRTEDQPISTFDSITAAWTQPDVERIVYEGWASPGVNVYGPRNASEVWNDTVPEPIYRGRDKGTV